MQMIPSAEAIGQGDCEASKTTGARTFVTRVAFTHAATLCNASGSRSEGWKTRTREISRKINDVLARAACDFEDDALRRQDIPKDTENEIAIAQCCRGILAGVVHHHPHAFPELGPQNSRLGKSRGNRRMSAHCCCQRPCASASHSIATCPFSKITASRGIATKFVDRTRAFFRTADHAARALPAAQKASEGSRNSARARQNRFAR